MGKYNKYNAIIISEGKIAKCIEIIPAVNHDDFRSKIYSICGIYTDSNKNKSKVITGFDLVVRALGYSFSDIAKILDISNQNVSDWATGKSKIPIKRAIQIAEILNVNLNTILKTFEQDEFIKMIGGYEDGSSRS